jgi:hypothetical protein
MQLALTRKTRIGDGWNCCGIAEKRVVCTFTDASVKLVSTDMTPQPRLLALISDQMHQ